MTGRDPRPPTVGSLCSGIGGLQSTSACNGPGSEPSGTSKTTGTPAPSSPNTGPVSPTTATSKAQTGTASNPSTPSAADTPARPSPTPADASGRTTPDTCGPTSSPPFAHYDPGSSSWRTSQGTVPWASDEFSGTWPRSGTTRRGRAFEHPTLVLPTAGNECSSSHLLPTPDASSSNDGEDLDQWQARRAEVKERGRNGNGFGTPLAIAVRLLPTPMAADGGSDRGSSAGWGLRDESRRIGQLLPTPTTRDHKGDNQRRDTTCLPGAVRLLPTPTTSDGNGSGAHGEGTADLRTTVNRLKRENHALAQEMYMQELPPPDGDPRGRLLPTPRATRGGSSTETAALLTGVSTSRPSAAGNTPSANPPPTLWTNEDDST